MVQSQKTLKHKKIQKNKIVINNNNEHDNNETVQYSVELLLKKLKSADTINNILNKTIEKYK